ncbi:hypothetical protein [Clostridium sardiniense]|uniref:hypothetical protein n=1 Tax=Clostridium sardiniense TaxID=29369 RepID=UPI001958B7AC|nr:hypothetical protein [Clostridium sardiniense]MBM7833169.1 hypothetical protein [Clostridium sardiniense]
MRDRLIRKITVTLIVIFLISIPLLPYKLPKKMDNQNHTMVKVWFSSMDGFLTTDGQGNSENKFTDSNIIGNTPYKELTTFKKGIPKYLEFHLYGEIKKEKGGYEVFDVKDWYPSNGHVQLLDTALWEEEISDVYFIIVGVMVLLGFITFFIKHRNRYD